MDSIARDKMAKRAMAFGTSMGVSSIIAILVILVLVVFSTLSIATSRADLRLSQKTSDSVAAFYKADTAAEDKMAEVSAIIAAETADSKDWRARLADMGCEVRAARNDGDGAIGGYIIGYTIPVDEYRNLHVELFSSGSDGSLKRALWQIVPAGEWEPDESLRLYTP